MAFGGVALKSVQLFLRFIEFCCACILLGIFSYFLATLHNHGLHIATWIRAVEGISGAAILYTAMGLILVCFVGGIAFMSLIAVVLDVCFAGAFIYVAWKNRGGDGSCRGDVNTPFGSGNTYTDNTVSDGKGGFTHLPSLHEACRLQTACFAVAIIAVVFFILSIIVEFFLMRHHKKEKAFGPSPNNGYTAGTPRRRFWQRRGARRDAELGAAGLSMKEKRHPDALPTHTTPHDVRNSYQTDTTAVGEQQQPIYNKYGPDAGVPVAPATHHAHGGLTTAPAGHHHTTTTTTAHHGVASEMPADGNYVRTHQPYNGSPTGTF